MGVFESITNKLAVLLVAVKKLLLPIENSCSKGFDMTENKVCWLPWCCEVNPCKLVFFYLKTLAKEEKFIFFVFKCIQNLYDVVLRQFVELRFLINDVVDGEAFTVLKDLAIYISYGGILIMLKCCRSDRSKLEGLTNQS